jgi:hypothetical protein
MRETLTEHNLSAAFGMGLRLDVADGRYSARRRIASHRR